MENMISIIIPSAKDPCLQKTIDDLRTKAEDEIEIIVVLDGKWDEIENADAVLFNEKRMGMRASINRGAEASRGEYVMKIDSHCMLDKGFDVKLLTHIQDDWVVIPRRYRLDIETWKITDDAPVDYERIMILADKLHGVVSKGRTEIRRNIMIDEDMVFQGSCWLMSRKHWKWLGGLQEEGYGTFTQEPIEIALKTWLGGGKVMINKNTWYAHKHRKFKRTVGIDSEEVRRGNAYSRDFWINNRWPDRIHDYDWLVKKFK